MNKSRSIIGLNADTFAATDGIGGNFELRPSARLGAQSLIVARLGDPKPYGQRRFATQTVPAWCHTAYIFERQFNPTRQTDWSFVAPVWIAVALFCTIVQVAAFKALFAAFG